MFFACSLTLDVHPDSYNFGASPFAFFIAGILLYDAWWLYLSRRYDTFRRILFWTVVNGATFLLSLLVFLVASAAMKADPEVSELLATLPIFVASVIDVSEMLQAKPLFKKWLRVLAEE